MSTTAFIVGSPRSGTTIMENVLDLHSKIETWYEPVFVIDRHFQGRQDDRRTAADATPEVKAQMREAFDYYRQKRGRDLIIDKNPLNSFKLRFLHEIFPDAKFIHMLRDGRDVTNSLNVEWCKREEILKSGNPLQFVGALKRYTDRQPLLAHKLAAIGFEIGSVTNLLQGPSRISYRTRRWHGRKGYGPQFPGWEDVVDNVPTLKFNAMQWRGCVEAVLEDQPAIPAQQFLEIRYENFLKDPEGTLKGAFDFLGLDYPDGFMNTVPELKRENYDKWMTLFTAEEKALIGPVLNPLLMRLGYTDSDAWFAQNA